MSVPANTMTGEMALSEDAQKEADLKNAQRNEKINILAQKLSSEATRRIGLRQSLEERWLEDIQQFNGVYDATTLANIKARKGSQLFINITRPKVKTAQARLADMLFPTDDKNWDITPTPVPELHRMLKSDQILVGEDGKILLSDDKDEKGNPIPLTEADKASMLMAKARERADAMSREIDDQLTEAKYPSECRKAIHDACLLGTGVIKGPIVVGRTRRAWKSVKGPSGVTVQVLETVTDPRPAVQYVNLWNFFPSPEAATMEENESTLERKYLTAHQVQMLKDDPYYFTEGIKQVLKLGPKAVRITRNPTNEKRDSTSPDGAIQSVDQNLYEIWEYHGPIDNDDLVALGIVPEGNEDPVVMIGCVVFCGSVVIKAYLNPLDTGEQIYSVFVFEKDEASIFGYGVPYRMRNAQRMLNGAVRALMDNAGVSAGAQVVINKKYAQPADGDYTLSANKVWEVIDPTKSVRDVFGSFNIESHQAELQAIINLAERFADEETALPMIAQGEQGAGVTKTLGGMSLLNNNANVIQKDTVKNWDDGITMPMIRRFYDWNMQYSEKEEIKGDYEVDARGSSVLLSKELQTQNLMALGSNFASHPVFGPMTKPLQLYRRLVQGMHIPPDEVVTTDAEYQTYLQNKSQAPQDPKIVVEQMRQEFERQMAQQRQADLKALEEQRHKNRMQEYELEHEDNLIRYASQERIAVSELKAMLAGLQIKGLNARQLQADKTKDQVASDLVTPPNTQAPPNNAG